MLGAVVGDIFAHVLRIALLAGRTELSLIAVVGNSFAKLLNSVALLASGALRVDDAVTCDLLALMTYEVALLANSAIGSLGAIALDGGASMSCEITGRTGVTWEIAAIITPSNGILATVSRQVTELEDQRTVKE